MNSWRGKVCWPGVCGSWNKREKPSGISRLFWASSVGTRPRPQPSRRLRFHTWKRGGLKVWVRASQNGYNVLPPRTRAPGNPRPYPGQAIRGAVQPLGGIAPLNSSIRGQPAPTFPSVETWGAEVHESKSSIRGQPAPTFPSVETWGAEVHESK